MVQHWLYYFDALLFSQFFRKHGMLCFMFIKRVENVAEDSLCLRHLRKERRNCAQAEETASLAHFVKWHDLGCESTCFWFDVDWHIEAMSIFPVLKVCFWTPFHLCRFWSCILQLVAYYSTCPSRFDYCHGLTQVFLYLRNSTVCEVYSFFNSLNV